MTSNDNTPVARLKEFMSKLVMGTSQLDQAKFQATKYIDSATELVSSVMESLAPVFQEIEAENERLKILTGENSIAKKALMEHNNSLTAENAQLKSDLQVANTKLTMYEARYATDSNYITILETKVGIANANHQNDQHKIEQLEKKLENGNKWTVNPDERCDACGKICAKFRTCSC